MKQYNLREILHKNVETKDLKEVELLLDHHPHLLSQHRDRFILINIAIENDDIELMNLLHKYNIDPNVEYKGFTSLHLAIQKNVNLEIIKSLISLSADLEACDKYGNTPLHFAIRIGDLKVIRELINSGANVNHMNNSYVTPLESAQRYKRIKASCLLIRAGAKKGNTFLETLKAAYTTANIYRKSTIITLTLALLSMNTIASVLTKGLLFPTIIISIMASIGIAIVCLAKPFFRVKALERKILNRQINHNELKELFSNPSISKAEQNLPATNLVPKAINDNYFLIQHKDLLYKSSDLIKESANF